MRSEDKDISNYIATLTAGMSEFSENMQEAQGVVNAGREALIGFYDVGQKVIADILPEGINTLSEATDRLGELNSELSELEAAGKGASPEAAELRGEISELEKAMSDAKGASDYAAKALAAVDRSMATLATGAERYAARMNAIQFTPSVGVTTTAGLLNMPSHLSGIGAGASIAGNADGGIISHPTLSWFAERVPEAAIPLENTPRSRALWEYTGARIGALRNPEPSPMDTLLSNYERGTINNNYGGNIEVKPIFNINVSGNISRSEARQAAKLTQDEFERMFDDMARNKSRLSFARG